MKKSIIRLMPEITVTFTKAEVKILEAVGAHRLIERMNIAGSNSVVLSFEDVKGLCLMLDRTDNARAMKQTFGIQLDSMYHAYTYNNTTLLGKNSKVRR